MPAVDLGRVVEVPIPYRDKRRNRTWMIAKIAGNLSDMIRPRRVIQTVPRHGPPRYHRRSHADTAAEARDARPEQEIRASEFVGLGFVTK